MIVKPSSRSKPLLNAASNVDTAAVVSAFNGQ